MGGGDSLIDQGEMDIDGEIGIGTGRVLVSRTHKDNRTTFLR
jgi:hypothetical protein